VSTRPAFRRRLAPIAGLLAAVGLLVTVPNLAHVQSAQASVTAGEVVFQQVADGDSNLVMLNGTSETALTLGPNDLFPDVSPDGSKVAFTSGPTAGGGLNGISVINTDGSGQVALTTADQTETFPSLIFDDLNPRWSPDGTKIVFARDLLGDPYTDDIMVMNADGTGLTDLTPDTSDTYQYSTPTWSPDGTKIAFTEYNATNEAPQVMVMNSDGTDLHLADKSDACSWDPDWSGSRIYVFHDCGPTGAIDYLQSTDSFASSADTSNTPLISSIDGGSNMEVRVSGDGSEVYYDNSSKLYSVNTGTADVTSVGNDDTSFAADIDPTPVKADWPNDDTKTLVALGDSVAAGEGINYGFKWDNDSGVWYQTGSDTPTWLDTTPSLGGNHQACHQSGEGYPNLFALNGDNIQVTNLACTGATAAVGILNEQPLTNYDSSSDLVAAQLGCNDGDSCDDPTTNIDFSNVDDFTITVGADDVDFSGWLTKCYGYVKCGSSGDTGTFSDELTAAQAKLRLVLSELNRRAGLADTTPHVLVTNYYNPFQSTFASCVDTDAIADTFPGLGIDSDEQTWIVDRLGDLNSAIADEVTYAQSHDLNLNVSPVDLSGAMAGHQFCTSDPWVYGPSINFPIEDGSITPASYPAPMHPTPDGQHKIYELVKAALDS
jgi:hypothetical protein